MSLLSKFSKKPVEVTSVAEALAGSANPPSAKPKKSKSKEKCSAEDEQLVSETKRARRRLIGAIAMVLAVVIGLPLVLDSEPQALNKNIAIQMPAKDEPHLLPSKDKTKEETLASETVEPASKEPSLPVVVSPLAKSKPADAKVARATAPALAKTNPDNPQKKEPTIKNNDDSARALAILNGVDPEKSIDTATSTRVILQVGAFATQDKVDELRSKLSSAGIKSFTQKVATSSGNKIRVRIGPFEDKESAGKIKKQLEKLGLNGSLIVL